MRTVQTVLDFFFETPQAYFCDRCGECHRAGECKAVEETTQKEPKAEEKTAPREPKEGEKGADEFKEEATPRKPKEKRKRRIRKERRRVKGSSRSLRARRGRDGVRRPGLKTGISGMMRTRLYEGGLDLPHRTHRLGASWVMRWGLDLDLPLISPANADPAAVPLRRVRSGGRGRS
jgi:hypothetical protein